MRDTKARFIGFAAIVLASGSYAVGHASADPTTEPDAAALRVHVVALQNQVDRLVVTSDTLAQHVSDLIVSANDQADSIDTIAAASSSMGCLAYSDSHYYKERVNKHGRKWKLPVMVWNMADRSCRPTAAVWKPRGQVLTNVVGSSQAR